MSNSVGEQAAFSQAAVAERLAESQRQLKLFGVAKHGLRVCLVGFRM